MLKKIASILLIIGGLNWGLYGLMGVDLVNYLPGALATIVYVLVGISAVVEIFSLSSCGCEKCKAPEGMSGASNNMM